MTRRRHTTLAAMTLLVAALVTPMQASGRQVPDGQAQNVLALAEGNNPEGIAFDQQGNLFIGNRRAEGDSTVSEILRIAPDGSLSTFATLATLDGLLDPLGVSGLIGLTTDRHGNVYAALVTYDPASHGVYRISADGAQMTRLPGSERIAFPNALVFDPLGNLYVTDSLAGAVWRFAPGGAAELWVQDPLLAPLPTDPWGVPLIGANGIAFYPPDNLYVANSEAGLILHVGILEDGSAGPVTMVAQGLGVSLIDGITVDATGQLYAVIPGFSVIGTSPLVRVDPATGTVTSAVAPDQYAQFDSPLSVTFGALGDGRESVFATNGDLGAIPGGHTPGVVQLGVGTPGFAIR